MSTSRCDKCGETVADIDAGFSPGLHEMGHECGGTWRVVKLGRPPLPPEQRAAETPVRTLRLSAEHWAELQARGGVQALREWLSRPAGRRTRPRA